MRYAAPLFVLALAGTALAQTEADVQRAEIAADAARRTSLLANNGSLGALDWQGADPVRLGGLFQFRYTANIRDDEPGEESFTHGFAVQYAQLTADADLNETWSVHLQGNFVRSNGTFTLDDAWADWKLDDSWTLRMGQFKAPFSKERLVSDGKLLAADRSEENSVFALNRTQGLEFIYDSDNWRGWLSFNTGASSINNDFNGASNADYAFTGRGEYRFAGDWAQLSDFTGWEGQENAGAVGAALHYQDGGSTGINSTGATPDVSLIALTVDAAYESNGWSVFGAFNWQNVDPATGDDMSDFGFLAQAGLFLSEADEIFGRYDVIIPDSDSPGGDDLFNTITIGWNHYFIPESHASKFTLDLQWFLDATTENGLVSANPAIGLLESTNENQFAIRAQYTASF